MTHMRWATLTVVATFGLVSCEKTPVEQQPLTMQCYEDTCGGGGGGGGGGAPPAVARVELAPDTTPGTYLAIGECQPFHAKAMSAASEWLQGESITWTTSTAAVISYDGTAPAKASTTHASADAVLVCGLTDGFGQVSATSSGGVASTPAAFQIAVGSPAPQQVATGGCRKDVPADSYPDPRANCVEIFGTLTVAVGGSQAVQCRGWGPVSVGGVIFSYPVAGGHPSSWWSTNSSIMKTYQQLGDYAASITGVSPGVANLGCSIDNGSTTVEVTVTGPARTVQSIFLLPNPLRVQEGQSDRLVPHFVDNYGQVDKVFAPIDEWTSDNPGVATVSGGIVTGIAAAGPTTNATAHVRARSGTMWSSPATIEVRPAPRVTTVSLSPASVTIGEGESATLTATVKDQWGHPMQGPFAFWTTSNGHVSVAATGNLTASVRGESWGSASVTADVQGISASSAFTVTSTAIGGYYVTGLSGPPQPITTPGTYNVTPTTSNAGTPPITYKWEVSYGIPVAPSYTTDFRAGPLALYAPAGAYRITITVTPKQFYGPGYPTIWVYNVCTGSGPGYPTAPMQPSASAGSGESPGVIERVVYGCSGQ